MDNQTEYCMGFAEFVLKRFETFSVNTVQLTRTSSTSLSLVSDRMFRLLRSSSAKYSASAGVQSESSNTGLVVRRLGWITNHRIGPPSG